MTGAEKVNYQVTLHSWTDAMLFEKLGRLLYFSNMDPSALTVEDEQILGLVTDELTSRFSLF